MVLFTIILIYIRLKLSIDELGKLLEEKESILKKTVESQESIRAQLIELQESLFNMGKVNQIHINIFQRFLQPNLFILQN